MTARKRPQGRPAPRSARALASLAPKVVDRLASAVLAARSPAEAWRDHLAVAHDLARARVVFLSVPDRAQGGLLTVAASRGRATESEVQAANPGEGAVGRAFSNRTLVTVGRHLAIPLVENGSVTGVLSIVGAARKVSPEVWRSLAAHLVGAAGAARARDAAVRRTRDLETAVAGLKSLERARDELLGNVSHELKSPLTTIKAYLTMARRERLGELTEKQRHAFDVCERNADRLLRLINDMLLMTRLQGEKMALDAKAIGLRSLAQDAVQSLAGLAASARVTVELSGGEVFVKGDRDRLFDAVAHLLENAIIYNHGEGKVLLALSAEAGVALFKVTDSGSGIAPEDLPLIFDRFWRGRGNGKSPGSSGLGLAIVRQIAQLHGGTISASSRVGKGSVFELRLPLFAGAVAGSAEREQEPVDGAVLLVEDDADCREVVAQVLSSEGVAVVEAADAPSAMRALQSSCPALVLLDLRLGGGDGREVLQRLRADPRTRDVPVFVISGATESAAGFRYDGPERIDAFFEKPLNIPRLLDRVQQVVRPSPGEQPLRPAGGSEPPAP